MQKESLNRNYEIYCKQLEDDNENLKQKLSDAETIIDEYTALDELEHITTALIKNILHYQKTRLRGASISSARRNVVDDFMTLKLSLPRQIGQSTCVRKSALKFFNRIHIGLPWAASRQRDTDPRISYHYLSNAHNLHGIGYFECIIIDPWSEKVKNNIGYEHIITRIDITKPGLIIQLGST